MNSDLTDNIVNKTEIYNHHLEILTELVTDYLDGHIDFKTLKAILSNYSIDCSHPCVIYLIILLDFEVFRGIPNQPKRQKKASV